MAGITMSRLALAMLGLSLLVLVVGQQADNSHFLSFNDHPPITIQQAPASPDPFNTPPTPVSQQAPATPLPINTPPAIPIDTPIAFPSPIPIDTPIAFPSPIPIDTPIVFPSPIPIDIPIPTLPIFGPGLGLPKNRHCSSMCSRTCSLQRRNRFAYMKCLGLCNLKCMGGISNVVFDCTKNCAESKSPIFTPDSANVLDFVSSCYEECKKN